MIVNPTRQLSLIFLRFPVEEWILEDALTEWQRQSCILSAVIQTLSGKSGRNMTRVSTLKSAAMAQAEPTAIPLHPPYSKHKVLPPDDRHMENRSVRNSNLCVRSRVPLTPWPFSLQNVVRITEKELHTVLFNHIGPSFSDSLMFHP